MAEWKEHAGLRTRGASLLKWLGPWRSRALRRAAEQHSRRSPPPERPEIGTGSFSTRTAPRNASQINPAGACVHPDAPSCPRPGPPPRLKPTAARCSGCYIADGHHYHLRDTVHTMYIALPAFPPAVRLLMRGASRGNAGSIPPVPRAAVNVKQAGLQEHTPPRASRYCPEPCPSCPHRP